MRLTLEHTNHEITDVNKYFNLLVGFLIVKIGIRREFKKKMKFREFQIHVKVKVKVKNT